MSIKRSETEWLRLIALQESSGESVLSFCRNRGLASSTFRFKKKELSAANGRERFRELTEQRESSVVLRIGGAKLELPADIRAEDLRKFLLVAKEV